MRIWGVSLGLFGFIGAVGCAASVGGGSGSAGGSTAATAEPVSPAREATPEELRITAEAVAYTAGEGREVTVDARLQFENPSNERVRVRLELLGFRCRHQESHCVESVVDLSTWVRGQPVELEKSTRAAKLEEGMPSRRARPPWAVFSWTVEFAPGESVEVRHRIREPRGFIDNGIEWIGDRSDLRSGAPAPKQSSIRFRSLGLRPWHVLERSGGYKLVEQRERLTNGKPEFELLFRGSGDLSVELDWFYSEYHPVFQVCPALMNGAHEGPEMFAELDDKQFALCEKMIEAHHGKPFAEAADQTYFYSGVQTVKRDDGEEVTVRVFEPNPQYSPDLFSPEDRSYLANLAAAREQKGR